MVVKEVGQDKILNEAARLAVEDCYPKIIKENNLEPLGPPEIDILKLAPNNPLEFRAKIFVLPEIKLPDYKKIAGQSKEQKIIVQDKEVEQALNQLQDMKDKIPKEQQDKISFDKPEELKKTLRKQMENEKVVMEKQRIRDEILSAIAKNCDWQVPEILILAERRRAMEDLKRKVSEVLKITFEDYLKKLKKSEKELEESLNPEILKRIKNILILREIQNQEKIEAGEDELEKEINAFLEHPTNQKIRESIDQTALRGYLKERIEQEKTLQFLEQLSN
jgi:FKBP-type peptidyl-prolyl cis-trans isomerase (trigger factor)